jgi:hypothetical protein
MYMKYNSRVGIDGLNGRAIMVGFGKSGWIGLLERNVLNISKCTRIPYLIKFLE